MNVYADNAATTKMCAAAIKEMLPYMMETYGNPSSLHSEGQKAAMALQPLQPALGGAESCHGLAGCKRADRCKAGLPA